MSSKLISVDDEEAEVLPHDQQQVPVSNNNADWASFTTTQATTTTTTTTTTTNEDPDDALSFIVLPPSTTNTTQQQQQQRVPLVTDDLRLGSGAFDDLDALFGDNNNNALKTSIAAAGAVAPTSKRTNSAASTVIDLTSVQVLSDELRRTAQLRALVLRALGELESVAQLLVDSAWSFPNETRQYSAPCGDRERTVFVASFTAAARDRARIDALRRQLRAICFAHERTHFLALVRGRALGAAARARRRLARRRCALGRRAATPARLSLPDSVRGRGRWHCGVGAHCQRRARAHCRRRRRVCARRRAAFRPLCARSPRRVRRRRVGCALALSLLCRRRHCRRPHRAHFADMQRTPPRVWAPSHYLSLLNRIDWRAVMHWRSRRPIAAFGRSSRSSPAERSDCGPHRLGQCDDAAVPGADVMFTERHTVLLARVFDALSLAPWPARGIALPFLALMPWARADARCLRSRLCVSTSCRKASRARQWSAPTVGGRTARGAPQRAGAPPRAHIRCVQAVYERVPRLARALGFGWTRRPAPASDAKAGVLPLRDDADENDDGRGRSAPTVTRPMRRRGGDGAREVLVATLLLACQQRKRRATEPKSLGLMALFRVLGVLAEADCAAIRRQQDKPPTLAVRVIDELCYFAFVHSQAGASLWIAAQRELSRTGAPRARGAIADDADCRLVGARAARRRPAGRRGVCRLRRADADALRGSRRTL
jgi:hypothetical protein